jgi:glycosyltransferase EpsD
MPKIVFISNVANFSKHNRPYMRWFKQQKWQVDYISAGEEQVLDCDNQYAVSIRRNPFNIKNILAYKQLKKILLNDYNIIHCHTPMGGFLARLVARNGHAKIIYTAHGFHFCKGASFINWLIFFPMEKYLSQYTDCLITINNEDYNIANKLLHPKQLVKVDGVGIDLNRFHAVTKLEKERLRNQLHYRDNDFILLYIAEFIPRKNHEFLLRQISKIKEIIPNLKIIFAGKGKLLENIKSIIATLNIVEIVDFLGYRNDVEKICQISDIYVSMSKQEGLAVSILEAMATGLPIVCSKIRGHIDSVVDSRNGFLFNLDNPQEMNNAIIKLYNNKDLTEKISHNNILDVRKYSIEEIIKEMIKIYEKYME